MTSPPQPRILMTTDAVGGVWTYSVTLVRELCMRGYEVTLVTLGPRPKPDQLAAIAGTRGLDIEITDLALEWMDMRGEDMLRAREELRRIAARVAPDIVHLNGFREALYRFNASTVVVAHSCVGSWWQACRAGTLIEPEWTSYLRRVKDALDAADVWIAATHAYGSWLEDFYRPRQRGEMIRNGISPIATDAGKDEVILAAGRQWDEAKNLAALADVAPDLPWPVRVAGTNKVENGGSVAFENVEELGALTHQRVLAEMARASIFVSPALYEPFGLSVLEAAAAGCALVLADIPTFRELWDGAALFVDPRDPAALREMLQLLCNEAALRRNLQQRARRRAARYPLENTVDRYCTLYDRLTSTVRPGHARAMQGAWA